MLVKDKLNQIARIIYREMGYVVVPGFDFTTSQHPTEKMVYRIAILIWEEILGDSPDEESDWEE